MIDVPPGAWHGVAMTKARQPFAARALPAVAVVALAAAGCSPSSEPASPAASSAERVSASQSPTTEGMTLTSSAFSEGETVPVEHTCDGADQSPPLTLAGVPEAAAGLVVVMEDPDAPGGTFDHWVSDDLEVSDEIPGGSEAGTAGVDSFGVIGYRGPCPPPGDPHRYVFRVLAVDSDLGLPEGETKAAVLAAAADRTVAAASLTGVYGR